MLIILTRFLNAQVSDTTVLLPSVTVVYEENEAEILWRQLAEYWPLYQKQSIESAKLYSRQSTSANEVVFEQVSNEAIQEFHYQNTYDLRFFAISRTRIRGCWRWASRTAVRTRKRRKLER